MKVFLMWWKMVLNIFEFYFFEIIVTAIWHFFDMTLETSEVKTRIEPSERRDWT